MNPRTLIIAAVCTSIAVIASIATASARDANVTSGASKSRPTAAAAFDFDSLSAGRTVPVTTYQSMEDTTTRNLGVAHLEPISDARVVGDQNRGIIGAVAPQQDGGLCYELQQLGTVGTGGCVRDFDEYGFSGSHGVVGNDYVVMGIVANDVSALALELPDGTRIPVSVTEGVVGWTRSVDEPAPIAIITTRGGVDHRRDVDLAIPPASL